jgi:hypothetical protein
MPKFPVTALVDARSAEKNRVEKLLEDAQIRSN